MILVETSAWIEHLRDGDQAVADAVDAALRSGTAASTEPVILELLAGARSEQHLSSLRGLLGRTSLLPVATEDWREAAQLYRLCRANGKTVRSMLDCLIGSVAIRNGVALLHRDRDFLTLAAHTPLQLHPV